jgi:general secretion pathway protein D
MGTDVIRQRLSRLARSLDVPPPAKLDNARVIRLRYSDAKQLAEILDAMGQGLKQDTGLGISKNATPPRTPSQIVVKADEHQNALVLIADHPQLRMIENIVRELDQPRAQVLIHAAIVEISGDIVEALGVQWGLSTGDAKGLINLPGTGISIPGGLEFDERLPPPKEHFYALGAIASVP